MFFPYVGSFKSIDIQPFFVIVSIIILPYIYIRYKVKIQPLSLLIALLIYLPIFFRLMADPWLEFNFFATYIFAFATAITCYILASKGQKYLSLRLVSIYTSVYFVIGLVQLFYNRNFLTFLVSRSQNSGFIDSLVESGRGVISLTAEPSQFGKLLIMLNILFILLLLRADTRDILNKIFFSLLGFIIINTLLSSSAYILLIHSSILFVFLVLYKRKILFYFMGSFFVLIPLVSLDFNNSFRLINIFQNVDNLTFLFQQGAFSRVMNLPISIVGFLNSYYLGLGNTNRIFYDSFYFLGEEFAFAYSSRNLGGYIEFLMRFGVFSFIFYLFYFFILKKIFFIRLHLNDSFVFIGPFLCFSVLLITIQDGSTINPISWFILFFTYQLTHKEKFLNYS